MADHQNGGTGDSLTPSSATSLFEQFIPDDESDTDETLDSNEADDEGSEHEVDGEESEVADESADDEVVEGDDEGEGEEEQEAADVPASRKLKVKLPEGEQEHGCIAMPVPVFARCLMSRSTFFSVRCSRVRSSRFGRRRGTVRFTLAGVPSLRCAFGMEISQPTG